MSENSPHTAARIPHPSRRAVVAGTAWTVPAIIVSVPAAAYAASCQSSYRLNWGTTTYSKAPDGNSGTAIVGPTSGSASNVNVTFASTFVGTDTRVGENLTVPAVTNIGGLGAAERGLALRHENILTGSTSNNRQQVVVTFSRAVTGLSFTMTDIDSNDGRGNGSDFYDQIEVTGARTGTGANIVGSGTGATPWQNSDGDNDRGDTNNGGNLVVTFTAPVTTFTIRYWSSRAGGNQRVFLSDFTFTSTCT